MDKVVHFEIPADDIERAQKFYKENFGWEINKIPVPGGQNYYMVTTVPTDEKQIPKETGAINGGMQQRDDTSPSPVLVIDVVNIDETLKKIESSGGTVVMPKMKVMDMGLYARVKDTEGNIIGVWQKLE